MRKDTRKGETEKNREKRMEVYRYGKKMARKISRVADRVLAGETETTACLMEGVDKNWMRRFIRGDISIKKGDEAGSGIVEVDRDDWASWQDLLLEELTGQEYYAPPGFDSIYEECVAEACSETEREVLRLRFQEGLTLREAGERIGKSQERVRQAESKALRALRHPRYRLRLAYGPEYTKAFEEAEDAQAVYDKARLAKMAELVEERKAAVQGCQNRRTEAARKVKEMDAEAAKGQEGNTSLEDALDEILLEDMGLSVRAYNALKKHCVRDRDGRIIQEPVRTVGQLSRLTYEDLCGIRNLGKRSVAEIEQALLTQYGIRIGTEQEQHGRSKKMGTKIQTMFMGDGIAILTENANGEIYLIKAGSIRDIRDDRDGECLSVPENDARVFFAVYGGQPVDPRGYGDFETLLGYLGSLGGKPRQEA